MSKPNITRPDILPLRRCRRRIRTSNSHGLSGNDTRLKDGSRQVVSARDSRSRPIIRIISRRVARGRRRILRHPREHARTGVVPREQRHRRGRDASLRDRDGRLDTNRLASRQSAMNHQDTLVSPRRSHRRREIDACRACGPSYSHHDGPIEARDCSADARFSECCDRPDLILHRALAGFCVAVCVGRCAFAGWGQAPVACYALDVCGDASLRDLCPWCGVVPCWLGWAEMRQFVLEGKSAVCVVCCGGCIDGVDR